jgi:hypothetical protein
MAVIGQQLDLPRRPVHCNAVCTFAYVDTIDYAAGWLNQLFSRTA